MSRKKLFAALTLSLIGLLVLLAWNPKDNLRYRGDGSLWAGSFLSHPRYVVTFSDISLNEASEHSFRLRSGSIFLVESGKMA